MEFTQIFKILKIYQNRIFKTNSKLSEFRIRLRILNESERILNEF